MASDFYFVPFGKERGGYLDLLGLPPNASEAEVATRGVEHRKQADKERREKAKELADKQKSGNITKEEYEAEYARLEEGRNKFLLGACPDYRGLGDVAQT
jgi:F0F1-type ATP synthase epsilon subunit